MSVTEATGSQPPCPSLRVAVVLPGVPRSSAVYGQPMTARAGSGLCAGMPGQRRCELLLVPADTEHHG